MGTTAADRSTKSNGTIFDLVTVAQLIGVIGTLLVVLFTLIKPEASNGLGLVARGTFWGLHVGLGLMALRVASRWLASRSGLPKGTFLSVLLTGCAAAMIAAPGYVALDLLFAPHVLDLDPDDPITNPVLATIHEFFDLVPFFLATWVLINLPILFRWPQAPVVQPENSPAQNNAIEDSKQHVTSGTEVDQTSPVNPLTDQQQNKTAILNSLPGIVGNDIIAISSDLHYLNVWTQDGRATVLGSLKDAVNELGDAGMQIHRSHWVANAHVRRVVGSASKGACILSNDLKIPVSRRRFKEVREFYGKGVVSQQPAK